MNGTKVAQLLSELDSKEIKAFKKYIHSPYFNTHKHTAVFFDVLYECDPSFNGNNWDQLKIFSKIYPEETFDEGKMRILRKYLFKHLLSFLAQQEFERYSIGQELSTLTSLLRLKEIKFFKNHAQKIRTHLENETIDSSRQNLYNYWFENLMIHFQTIHGSRWETKNFERVNEKLSQYFVVEKLRIYCSKLNEAMILDKEMEEDPIINLLLVTCEQHFDEMSLLNRAYYCLVLIGLHNERLDCYKLIKADLPKIQKHCLRSDQINIYNYLINFCYKLYRRGKSEFEKEMLLLYKQMLDHKLLFSEGFLSINHYKNISTLGLRLGEFEWTKNFIEQYKNDIDIKYQEAVYSYNMALWFFYHQDYGETLRYLQMMVFIDPFYKISHDLLLLKVYFEQSEEESFIALCLNFQNFIRRKKTLENDQQRAYLNFIQSARALFLVKIGERDNLEKAIERLERSEVILEKVWLLEKANQLSST